MSRVASNPSPARNVAELLKRLGGIPARRVRLVPTPGTATERDVLSTIDHEGFLCELIDGVLVEKPMVLEESQLTVILLNFIYNHVLARNLGIVAGADGTMRLTTGLLRIPDISFFAWDSLPGRVRPRTPVPMLTLDLAVEVLSKGNTRAEMRRKLGEYFDAGTRLVWFIDLRTREASVYTALNRRVDLGTDGTLDGGDVLPGFSLPLATLFGHLDRRADA